VAFAPTLLRAAYVLLGDIDLAEDAVQGTMLRVFRRWDHARQAPEAYSRRTLVNVCRDQWRRSRRRPVEVPYADEIDSQAAPFTDGIDDRETLKQALRELPQLQCEVLTLRFFFDLPIQETAEILGIPVGTAKSATSRGLQALRRELSPRSEEAR
jgi:RNA polymerase sigma-70 factor (sigma-E family)